MVDFKKKVGSKKVVKKSSATKAAPVSAPQSSAKKVKDPCTIVIPARLSYPSLFHPVSMEEGKPPRYSVSCIIPKKDADTKAIIDRAVKAAIEVGKTKKWGGVVPGKLKLPLNDGNDRKGTADEEAYKNCWSLSAYSNHKPGVIYRNRMAIQNEDDIYPGCYALVSISMYPFNSGGSKGVAVSLNHVMKTEDGERLAGRIDVDSAFEGFGDDEDTFAVDDEDLTS